MRQLPTSPSLEHLRGQAKSLLKALLAGDGEARKRFATHLARAATADRQPVKLADAQVVLAREYGFPSWGRLKTYVVAAQELSPAPTSRADRRSPRRQFV